MKSTSTKSRFALLGALLLQSAAAFGAITFTTQPPLGVSVVDGTTLSITTAATPVPAAPVTYQWFKGNLGAGVARAGATAAKLTIPAIKATDAGTYYCRAIAAGETAFSTEVVVTVNVRPKIATQPTAPTTPLAEGANQTFSLVLDPTTTLPATFVWEKKTGTVWNALPGQPHSATYQISGVGSADAGNYRCKVSNITGVTVISKEAILKVNARPFIVTEPGAPTGTVFIAKGGTGTVKVVAGGVAPFTYQWQRNGVDVNKATAATLSIKGDDALEGNYTVKVSNKFSPVNTPTVSMAAAVTVINKPKILTQPTAPALPLVVGPGVNHQFSVVAENNDSGTVTYQWQKDGKNIVGATNATLDLTPVQWTDRGAYKCIVKNEVGSVTSSTATLKVDSAPIIITEPVNTTGAIGKTASFAVVAGGNAPLTYQWTFKRVGAATFTNLATGKAAKLTLSKLLAPTDPNTQAGVYKCIVTNKLGNKETVEVTLDVLAAPVITGQPGALKVAVGGNINLNIVATGDGTLNYQWQRNGVNIPGAPNANALSLPANATTDSGTFRCIVTNSVGTATSLGALVTVQIPPNVTTDPTDVTTVEDEPSELVVAATGSATLKYQWQKQEDLGMGNFQFVNITGKTAAKLSFAKTAIVDQGTYRCIVTNDVGADTSLTAQVTVNPVPVPTVTGFYPSTAMTNEKVRLLGTGLKYVNSVKINNVTCGFVVEPNDTTTTADDTVLVTVPATAPQTDTPFVVASKNGGVTTTGTFKRSLVVANDSLANSTLLAGANIANYEGSTLNFPGGIFAVSAFYEWKVPARSSCNIRAVGQLGYDLAIDCTLLDAAGVPIAGTTKSGNVINNNNEVVSIDTNFASQSIRIVVRNNSPINVASAFQGNFRLTVNATPRTNSIADSDFEDQSTGPVSGKGGWTSSSSATTANVVTDADGNQSVVFGGSGASGTEPVFLWKDLEGSTANSKSVTTGFKMSLTGAEGDDSFAWQVDGSDGAPLVALWVNSATGTLRAVERDGTVHESIQHLVSGSPHRFEVVVDHQTNTWSARIDGAPVTEPIALPKGVRFGDVSAVWDLGQDGQASGASINFDDFSVTAD